MNVYKLEDFKEWLEANKASQGGMEEHWKYFLSWYKENPDIWEATTERGMGSVGYKLAMNKLDLKFNLEILRDYDKEVENLYTAIFTWKREVDSKQKKYLSGYEQQEILLSQIPIVKQTEEEIELRKEISQLKSDLKQEKNKNQKIQDKIIELEQVNRNLKSKCRKQEEQLEELTILRQKLSNAQNQVKELKQKLGINIQTTEKSIQTEFEWEEEIKQKDLKIEELKQQLAKQKQSAKNQQINSNLKDSSWANLVNKNQTGGFIKPSQLKKIRQEQQSAQTQNEIKEQNNQEINCLIQQNKTINIIKDNIKK